MKGRSQKLEVRSQKTKVSMREQDSLWNERPPEGFSFRFLVSGF